MRTTLIAGLTAALLIATARPRAVAAANRISIALGCR
jgi:hypothetical protein